MPNAGSGPRSASPEGRHSAALHGDLLPRDRGGLVDFLRERFDDGRRGIEAEMRQPGRTVGAGRADSRAELAALARSEAGSVSAAAQRLGAMALGLVAAAAGGAAAQRALRRAPRPGNR